jgi:hypothetical protein
MKEQLSKEGCQLVTKCNRLKLEAADSKKYITDIASAPGMSAYGLNPRLHAGIPPGCNIRTRRVHSH